jgi:hypothetical protein
MNKPIGEPLPLAGRDLRVSQERIKSGSRAIYSYFTPTLLLLYSYFTPTLLLPFINQKTPLP